MKTKNPPEGFAEINIGYKQPMPKPSSAFNGDLKGKDMVNR